MAFGSYSSPSAPCIFPGGIPVSPIPPFGTKNQVKHFLDGTNYNMEVDGSSVSKIYEIAPPSGETWYCDHITFAIDDNGTATPENYGGIAGGITNGFLIESVVNSVSTEISNIKNNGDIILTFDHGVSFLHTGQFFSTVNGFASKRLFSVPIILVGASGDKLKATVRDNLTSLVLQRMSASIWRV